MSRETKIVSNDTAYALNEESRIESRLEINTYLQNLRYALANGATITFQRERAVDKTRDKRYTNDYTVADLFPNEDIVDALRRELNSLTIEEYIRTVKDRRYPERNDMREFGRMYAGSGDVYIKIRVELLSAYGNHTAFVMSFHYAVYPFTDDMFPYKTHAEEVKENDEQ